MITLRSLLCVYILGLGSSSVLCQCSSGCFSSHRRFFPHTQNGTTNNHRHFLIRLKSNNQCLLFSQCTMRNDNARGLPYLLRFGKHRETESPVRGSSNDILHSPAVSRSPQQTALEGGKLEIQILIGLNGFLFHYSPVSGGGRPSGLGNGRACVSEQLAAQPHHCWDWP